MRVPVLLAGSIKAFLAVSTSCVVAELSGYWLHRLLHSHRFPLLSRSHLIHHFHMYAPDAAMRSDQYRDATDDRPAIGNVGLEWLVPSAILLSAFYLVLWFLRVPFPYRALCLCTMTAWSVLMFSYLHDRMHLTHFWMARTPLLRSWFVRARRFHDIHHRSLNDDGTLDRNFGIGFFFCDRVFGTLARRHRSFNRRGLAAAKARLALEHLAEEPTVPSHFHLG